ncbi:MAG: hypothetical protein ABI627_26795 [Polyangiaceae bacterium]
MTEELWLKIIADPIVAPPAIRLTDLGIAQNALWDIIKFGLGVAATRVSNP